MRRRHGDRPARRRRQMRQAPQERSQQQVRVRQARGRVAGHAEHRRRADVPERRRLARLDRDAVERHVPLAAQNVAGQVAFADGTAAGEHQHVRPPGDDRVDGGVERFERVAGDGMGRGDPAVLGDDRGQRVAVDVVDLSRGEGPAGFDQLVSGRHDGDPRPVVRFDLREAEGRGGADPARRQHVAGAEHGLPGGDVGAPPADVLARLHRLEHVDPRAAPVGPLHHHDRVGAVGNRRPGRDLDALPGGDRAVRRRPAVDRSDAAQPGGLLRARAGRVRRRHGVAVHRGAVERRHVAGRDDAGGQHPAVRLGQADPHRAVERPGGGLDDAQRVVDRDRLPEGTHPGAAPRAGPRVRPGRWRRRRAAPGHRRASRTMWPISGTTSFVIASRTAFSEPGRLMTMVPRARPAQARLSIAAGPISW